MDAIQDGFDGLRAFVDKLEEELRSNLGQSQPGNATIGISFAPEIVLNYVPSHEIVKTGMYESKDGCVHVEVLQQDSQTGLIHLEVYDEVDVQKRFDFTSTGMFLRLFKPTTPLAYIATPAC